VHYWLDTEVLAEVEGAIEALTPAADYSARCAC
jgi:hypothetical protein